MIARRLLDTGILQFGLFEKGRETVPYRLRLELLAAYPDLLAEFVGLTAELLPDGINRIVAHADSVPLAAVIGLEKRIALVYSRGRGETPVHDLIGAYDIGHPACLLTNTMNSTIPAFIDGCERVGLNVHSVVVLMDEGRPLEGVTVHSVLRLDDVIRELMQAGEIPVGQARHVLGYLQNISFG